MEGYGDPAATIRVKGSNASSHKYLADMLLLMPPLQQRHHRTKIKHRCSLHPLFISTQLTENPPLENPSAPSVSVVAATPLRIPEAAGIIIRAMADAMKPEIGQLASDGIMTQQPSESSE